MGRMEDNIENTLPNNEIPAVPVLLAKIRRQTARIIDLEKEVSRLQEQQQQSRLNEESFISCSSKSDFSGPTVTSSLNENTVTKETATFIESKYQALLKKHQQQTKELEAIKAESRNSRRAKRRTSWEKWEADLAEERVVMLEEYVSRLEAAQSNEGAVEDVILKEVERYRNEARELREALSETHRDCQILGARMQRAEQTLKEISQVLSIDDYVGREEILVAAVANEKKRATASHNLALKARGLLNTALEERDRVETVFKETQGLSDLSLAHIHGQLQAKRSTAAGHAQLAHFVDQVRTEMNLFREKNAVLAKEQHHAKQAIASTLRKCANILNIPEEDRASFDTLHEGIVLMSKLVLSQITLDQE